MRARSKPFIAVLDFQEDGCEPGSGRSLAEGIAVRFRASALFDVVDREEWHETLGGKGLNRECCFHPGWAADMARLIGADAVVLGRASKAQGSKTSITAITLDASGVALATAKGDNVDYLANLLVTGRLARAIRTHNRPVTAKIEFVEGSSLLLNIGRNSWLRQEDRLRIDCALETIVDPYFQDELRMFDYLVANIGEAEVVEVGACLSLVRYIGCSVPKTGDLVTLSKI